MHVVVRYSLRRSIEGHQAIRTTVVMRGGYQYGRGRGRHGGIYESNNRGSQFQQQRYESKSMRGDETALSHLLRSIDGKSYPAYKDLYGEWSFQDFSLIFDQIQGDPYASPSRVRVRIPGPVCGLPEALWQQSAIRRVATCDFLARCFGDVIRASRGDARAQGGGWSGEKGGDMTMQQPSQFVCERSSVTIGAENGMVEVRFTVGLPARGRSVLGRWAHTILVENLPRYVSAIKYAALDAQAIQRHVECVEDTHYLRAALQDMGLVSFIGNGSILPRKSGSSDKPMMVSQAVPFRSPASMEVGIQVPNRGLVKGMGIKEGITLIVGGGFHGKSTLLEAIQTGVYNKIPGDGRELVVTVDTAVKIRAEDGRKVDSVDISPFISNLPGGKSTTNFTSLDASGSTSQASNIQEALEIGCRLLLIDEDTSATNFMVRDARMRELIQVEPITPFVERVYSLSNAGVSTILVIGGTGEYFAVSNKVIAMKNYMPEDVTSQAKSIAQKYDMAAESAGILPAGTSQISNGRYPPIQQRVFVKDGFRGDRPKCKTQSLHSILMENEVLDLQGLEQIIEIGQTKAISDAILYISGRVSSNWKGRSIKEIIDIIEAEIDSQGLDFFANDAAPSSLTRPRRFELMAALNRLRTATFSQHNCSLDIHS